MLILSVLTDRAASEAWRRADLCLGGGEDSVRGLTQIAEFVLDQAELDKPLLMFVGNTNPRWRGANLLERGEFLRRQVFPADISRLISLNADCARPSTVMRRFPRRSDCPLRHSSHQRIFDMPIRIPTSQQAQRIRAVPESC